MTRFNGSVDDRQEDSFSFLGNQNSICLLRVDFKHTNVVQYFWVHLDSISQKIKFQLN